eukprot:364743-Chlamydomonas_euryale.AAC.60
MRAWHALSVPQGTGHLRVPPFGLQARCHGPPCHVVLRRCSRPRFAVLLHHEGRPTTLGTRDNSQVTGVRLLGVAHGVPEGAADNSADDSKYCVAPDSLFHVPSEAEVGNEAGLSPRPTGAGDSAGVADEPVAAMPLDVHGFSSTTTATNNSNGNTAKGSRWLEKDSILLASEVWGS